MPTIGLGYDQSDDDWLQGLFNQQAQPPADPNFQGAGLSLNGYPARPVTPTPGAGPTYTADDIVAGRTPLGKQEARPYDDPTWAGQLQHKFEQGASGLGAGPAVTASAGDIGNFIGGTAGSMSLHDFEPNIIEAYRRANAGQYGQAFGSLLAAAPLAPGATMAEDVAKTIGKDAIESAVKGPLAEGGFTAYHGSPYDFDRFDTSKIGTGEGAQVYGHGLYFAGNEDVARNYRNSLAPGFVNADGSPLSDATYSALAFIQPKYEQSGQLAEGIQDAIGRLKNQSDFYRKQYGAGVNLYDNAIDTLQNLDPATLKPAGHMYQVNINANPANFLDWDKPFAEQSPTVQQAINKLWTDKGGSLQGRNHPPFVASSSGDSGQNIHAAIASTYGDRDFGTEAEGEVAASKALQGAGVPGIKYLDQGSRGAGGEGTSNYVAFSDNIIDILRKYGLAGLGLTAGAGALATQRPSKAEAAPQY
jgi:hypothetical protein